MPLLLASVEGWGDLQAILGVLGPLFYSRHSVIPNMHNLVTKLIAMIYFRVVRLCF